jgi:hypothetical protein
VGKPAFEVKRSLAGAAQQSGQDVLPVCPPPDGSVIHEGWHVRLSGIGGQSVSVTARGAMFGPRRTTAAFTCRGTGRVNRPRGADLFPE